MTSRVSTAIAIAVPFWISTISRATVLMVEDGELGGGGKGMLGSCGFEVDLAATTTWVRQLLDPVVWKTVFSCVLTRISEGDIPAYPFRARSMAICRPIPREAPITRATCFAIVGK